MKVNDDEIPSTIASALDIAKNKLPSGYEVIWPVKLTLQLTATTIRQGGVNLTVFTLGGSTSNQINTTMEFLVIPIGTTATIGTLGTVNPTTVNTALLGL